MKAKYSKKVIAILLLIIVLVVSFFPIGNKLSKVDTYKTQIEYLDKKSGDALKLTAIAASTSTAISLLPNDIGTPVANELMDITSYFGIALAALMLEKYLLPLIGFVVFKVLIPISCIVAIIAILNSNYSLRSFAKKLALFGLVILLIVPTSVKASQAIEAVYGFSIEDVEKEAANLSEESVSEDKQEVTVDNSDTQSEDNTSKQNNIFKSVASWITSFSEKTAESAVTLAKKAGAVITSGAQQALEKAQNILSNMIEKLAILIITSCLIPLLVIIAFIFISKALLKVDFSDSIRALDAKRANAVKQITHRDYTGHDEV